MPTQQEVDAALNALRSNVPFVSVERIPNPPQEQVATEMPQAIDQDIVKNNNIVLNMRLQRTRDGIKFYVKSPIIEDFIKTATKNKTNNETSLWGEMPRYKEVGLSQFTLSGITFNAWGGNMYVSASLVNLSFLRVVGLSDGKEFLLQEMATKEKLERFTQDFKNSVKSFYREFMKPFDIQVDITVEESRSNGQIVAPIVETTNMGLYKSNDGIWKFMNIPVGSRVTDAIFDHNNIKAINEFRYQYTVGLREAKELVETLSGRLGN